MTGLWTINPDRQILLFGVTATMTHAIIKYCKNAIGCENLKVNDCVAESPDGTNEKPLVAENIVTCQDEDTIRSSILTKIAEIYHSQPIIVFCT